MVLIAIRQVVIEPHLLKANHTRRRRLGRVRAVVDDERASERPHDVWRVEVVELGLQRGEEREREGGLEELLEPVSGFLVAARDAAEEDRPCQPPKGVVDLMVRVACDISRQRGTLSLRGEVAAVDRDSG